MNNTRISIGGEIPCGEFFFMSAYKVYYEGRVQGVGFRYTVKQIATGFEVVGWVRNLADGRVEMDVMGDDQEVDEFLQEIRESVLASHIQKVDASPVAPLVGVKGFAIKL